MKHTVNIILFACNNMLVTELKSLEEIQKIIADSKNLVVFDWFALWCGPCKAISPKIEKLALQHKTVSFYKIDIDQVNDAAQLYKITAMPTFHFFKDGKLLNTVVGANFQKIAKIVADHA